MAEPEWLWADPINLNFNKVPSFKEVNIYQWGVAGLYTNEKYESLIGPGYFVTSTLLNNVSLASEVWVFCSQIKIQSCNLIRASRNSFRSSSQI